MPIASAIKNDKLIVSLDGDFIDDDNTAAATRLSEQLEQQNISRITFETGRLGKWDSTLMVVIYDLCRQANSSGTKVDLAALPENLRQLISLALEVDRKPEKKSSPRLPFLKHRRPSLDRNEGKHPSCPHFHRPDFSLFRAAADV